MNRRGPKDKNKNVKPDEKGKQKVEEIWVKKTDSEARSGSTLDSDAGTTSGN